MDKNIEQQIRAEVWKQDLNKNADADLSEVFTELWRKKLLIVIFGIFFGVLGIIYALSQPNIYKASTVVAPAGEQSNQNLSGLNGLGGLASLAGFNLTSANAVDKTQMALQIIKSRKFIADFVERHNLKPLLFATKEWLPESNTIVFDQEVFDENNKTWTRSVKFPYVSEPSDQEVVEVFRNVLEVEPAEVQGFYQISFLHQSPYIAKEVVESLVHDLNDYMRKSEQAEANKSIQFLNSKLLQVNAAEIRTVMYELIEEQTKTLMFTEVREEYIFQTVDPAVAPEQRDSPARTFIVLFSGVLGGTIGCLVVLVLMVIRKTKQPK
ncbi:Wzz/FepE/Etk N-terminal domain-containing protein [Pseudidiomarina sp.]|uniref:Wzz/FepE/Etk N-terminal domain-containing protein n=1 Tax=Pseudidiomarina sp. TaxID=2081707 RepID=UPI003A96A6F9